MALCLIVENPDLTEDLNAEIMNHVRSSGPVPPEGARLVMAGPAERGWRVISVWDSQEAQQRFFAERLAPAYAAAGASLENVTPTLFELHTLVAGDLTGAPTLA